MSKIKDDDININIKVSTEQAQQEIRALSKTNKELKEEAKRQNDELTRMESIGQKNTTEYKNMKAALKGTKDEIAKNDKAIAEYTKSVDVNSMTMAQLKKRYKALRQEMDNTSKSLEPEAYAALDKEMNKVGSRMRELGTRARGLKEIFNSRVAQDFLAGNILMKVGEKIGEFISDYKELVKESYELAKANEGIKHAFDKIDDGSILQNLRASTHGTVSDLELMKATVRARDFQIPLEDLGKYLEFAQLKAQETGQDVGYLTESIIMGLGRRSIPILDNLGLSSAQISKEMQKTGDFTKAVAAIVDDQLANAGEHYETTAERILRRQTELQNAQRELGEAMLPISETAEDMGITMQMSFIKATKFVMQNKAAVISFTVALVACSAAIYLHAKRVTIAAAAQRLWNAVIAGGPIGLLIGLVMGAATALYFYTQKASAASKAQKALNDVQKRASEISKDEVSEIKKENAILHNNKLSLDRRREALKRIMDLVPSYHATLTEEGKLINETTGAIQKQIEAIQRRAKAQASEELLQDAYRKQQEAVVAATEKGEAGKTSLNMVGIATGSPVWLTKTPYSDDEKQGLVDKAKQDNQPRIDAIQRLIEANEAEAAANGATTNSRKDLIKEKEKELEAAQKVMASTEEEIKKRNQNVQKIQEEITRLKELGVEQKKHKSKEDEKEKKKVKTLDTDRTADLNTLRKNAQEQELALSQSLKKKELTYEQAEIARAHNAKQYAKERLDQEQKHLAKLETLTFKNEEIKADAIQKAQDRVLAANQQYINASLAQDQLHLAKANELADKWADELTKNHGSYNEKENYQVQMDALKAAYDTRINMAKKEGADLTAIHKAYEDAKEKITLDYNQHTLEIRKKFGLDKQQSQYDAELAQLKEANRLKLISDEEYASKSKEITAASIMAKVKQYGQLLGGAVEAIQNAEISNMEAKYDAEIAAAGDNQEEIERLEEEKAKKKLAIQKKYADVDFMIKASQIIADTSVAIMKTLATLGPIAGPIQAALIGVTGAAQLAAANAERTRIKNMTINGSSSSSTSSSASRVATGREEGGSIDVTREQDGKYFPRAKYRPRQRGYIDRPTVIVGEGPTGRSKEWVASNAAVTNPTVYPILNMIDQAQQAGTIRSLDLNRAIQSQMLGYANGGSIDRPMASTAGVATGYPQLDPEVIYQIIKQAIGDAHITAPVVLSDLDAQRARRDAARRIGSKK